MGELRLSDNTGQLSWILLLAVWDVSPLQSAADNA